MVDGWALVCGGVATLISVKGGACESRMRWRRLRPFFSFEFFPPKDDAGSKQLFATIEALAPLRPAFVSITYGAGGSSRDRTVALAKQIQAEIGLTVMAHVTCVGSSRAELRRSSMI